MEPETVFNDVGFGSFASAGRCVRFSDNKTGGIVMRVLTSILISALATGANAQLAGIPASDTLGADDLYGNPSLIGGVANGGGTAHGIW